MKRLSIGGCLKLSMGLSFAGIAATTARGGVTPDVGSSVFAYNSGDVSDSFYGQYVPNNDTCLKDASGALGVLTSEGGYGFNPFAPQYNTNQLAFVGGGGYLDIVLSSPVAGNGYLGIFTNAFFADVSSPGDDGETGPVLSPSSGTYAAHSFAEISVGYLPPGSTTAPSLVNVTNGNVVIFDVPSNYYNDTIATTAPSGGYVLVSNGSEIASQAIPYYVPPTPSEEADGEYDSLIPLENSTLSQIESDFNCGAGGTWIPLDLSPSNQFNFIEFSVPDGYALALDSIAAASASAVPEPGSLALLALGGLVLLNRRRALKT
ncbi:MAG TPA: PEP-CTERM sorting domain-containing protein [Phycisphaerae bacterium]|nr:PEP-CTERM sorting domain-containing protein [Phycisphaerae bacterium]